MFGFEVNKSSCIIRAVYLVFSLLFVFILYLSNGIRLVISCFRIGFVRGARFCGCIRLLLTLFDLRGRIFICFLIILFACCLRFLALISGISIATGNLGSDFKCVDAVGVDLASLRKHFKCAGVAVRWCFGLLTCQVSY